jgi:hypothetical protein
LNDPRIEEARRKAYILYEGVETPHRSCGISLAETFGLPTAAYQSFRKGGILGNLPCGSIQAGLAILGQLLGDPDPTGAVTAELRAAAEDYERRWRVTLFPEQADPDIICNHLTGPLGDFDGDPRKSFCTHLTATVAALVAEVALRHGADFSIHPIAG